MRFFMVYSNQWAIGNKPIGIASLAAVLKRAGHEFQLFDCTKYKLTQARLDSNASGEDHLEFKIPTNGERLPPRIPIAYEGLVERLMAAIDDYKPDMVGLSALTDDYPLGLGLMRQLKKAFPSIPTIAGGVHATVDPTGVIAESCFDMVCVGEGEYVILDIADRFARGESLSGIANAWLKRSDGTVERNAVRPYETILDKLPFPDWTIYPDVAFYKPFRGYVYKYGDFEMSRGCPYKCSYCINVHLQEIYKGYQYHREKSIPRVIQEIQYAIEHYGIEFLKFWDETFLLMSKERMEEFCDLYSSQIGLPYVVETTGGSIDEFSAKVLQKTNCRSASLGMETGSPDMRKGLLHKPTDNSAYVTAFRLLEEHGIQKASFNMIGLPTEGAEDIFRTIALNRLTRTEVQAVGIFYPYKGTPIRDMMIREGWMDDDFDLRDLKDYDFNTFTAGNRSVVRFKDMNSEELRKYWKLFSSYVMWPVELYPLIDYLKNHDDEFARTLLRNMQRVYYFKKYEEWPPASQESDAGRPRELPKQIELADAEAREFASLLVQNWVGDKLEELFGILSRIASGELKPEYEVPTERDSLARWLEIEVGELKASHVRTELRAMAHAKRDEYSPGILIPEAQKGDPELVQLTSHPVRAATE